MQHHTHQLLSPVPGTARCVHSFHYGPQNGAGKVYIQASLHADELPGMLVAWHLKQRLAELDNAGRLLGEVVVVPVANPIGLEQVLMDTPLGRYELESGQNFNRGFVDLGQHVGDEIEARLTQDASRNRELVRDSLLAALNAQTATTQLHSLRLTLQRLACDADMVLDLHCDFESVEHLYTTPEAWPKVEPLSRYLGAQASLLATDSGGQSFDECFTLVWWQLQQRFGERFPIPLGSFSVTLELRGQGDVNHSLASRDCQAIINYLIDFGLIDGERQMPPELLYPATPLAAVEPVATPVGGLLVFCAMPGEHVDAGQLIAEIIDPISDAVTSVHALNAGLLYARSLRRMATAGMVIAHVAGKQAYRSGYLLSP
ncbi:succinylglutamate desuccinylase/aspartoacylase family protein [Pseudomonas alliivorans]|uniref:Succinylglutamate desuccinylase/aspartoacylase family protein n=1 Tax=Pseudomonas alliivorans TaxID=2810613 RepID=A0ABS4CA57_9PSED|nr:succinylglutamate desuccinylase/aspartoacylase family protein [Pseudomonas alliivorans]MBP0947571.1 succinylglutamate desuccinylase/aspartoacylase family protein [Pseudomonas alliivorans]MCO5365510.1 M14 family metallopeptidase [Pseudomonas alliivorans]MEE4308429.1 succinylglutamate desuccinylase/aspartoacylase family protein [Pseudomonas alliivorans]MEE4328110.1 succinylglutamate desuccinylase/aspartoacylase family protein [Pseudomonas alliivorans]MEE4336030.1 succinylglutamate desuccinyla